MTTSPRIKLNLGQIVEIQGERNGPWLRAKVTDWNPGGMPGGGDEFEVELVDRPGLFWSNGSGLPWRLPPEGE